MVRSRNRAEARAERNVNASSSSRLPSPVADLPPEQFNISEGEVINPGRDAELELENNRIEQLLENVEQEVQEDLSPISLVTDPGSPSELIEVEMAANQQQRQQRNLHPANHYLDNANVNAFFTTGTLTDRLRYMSEMTSYVAVGSKASAVFAGLNAEQKALLIISAINGCPNKKSYRINYGGEMKEVNATYTHDGTTVSRGALVAEATRIIFGELIHVLAIPIDQDAIDLIDSIYPFLVDSCPSHYRLIQWKPDIANERDRVLFARNYVATLQSVNERLLGNEEKSIRAQFLRETGRRS